MSAGVQVQHSYPAASPFLRLHGPVAIAVLHDLLAHAERRGSDLVVQASVRQVAQRLGFASKDTVHRHVRQLVQAGVLHQVGAGLRSFEPPTYRVELSGTGICVTASPGVGRA